jgi:high-affinity iron transporter
MAAALAVAAVLVWQGLTAAGNPIPTPGKSIPVASLDVAVLVTREGLESILVFAAIIAGLKGRNYGFKRPIELGAGLGFVAVIVTWFVAISLVSDLAVSYGELSIQASTGIFAVVVILIETDWFFHGVYWSGWISIQNKSKQALIAEATKIGKNSRRILLGLIVLGFASVFREGFEVVLFLQSYYLEMGPAVVYYGAAAGLVLILAMGYLTFLGQRHLPYKRMLVVTGVLLTGVVFVMAGEVVNQMQASGWIGTTNIAWLQGTPAWAEEWFSIFPNVQTLVAQALALGTVGGSYFFVRFRMWRTIQKSKNAEIEGNQKE